MCLFVYYAVRHCRIVFDLFVCICLCFVVFKGLWLRYVAVLLSAMPLVCLSVFSLCLRYVTEVCVGFCLLNVCVCLCWKSVSEVCVCSCLLWSLAFVVV